MQKNKGARVFLPAKTSNKGARVFLPAKNDNKLAKLFWKFVWLAGAIYCGIAHTQAGKQMGVGGALNSWYGMLVTTDIP